MPFYYNQMLVADPHMPTFLEVVRQRVYMLLKDKETKKSGDIAKHWLSREAASLDVINKAGTFR